MNNIKFIVFTILGGISLIQSVQSNGLGSIFTGVANWGTGGAGIGGDAVKDGLSVDAAGINSNPALAADVPNQMAFGIGPQYQRQKFDTSHSTINQILGPGFPPHQHPLTNKYKFFPASNGGVTYRLNDKFTMGMGLAGFSWGGGGGFVGYKQNIISPALPRISTTLNLAAMLIPFTLAVQPTPYQSYGVSLIAGFAGIQANLAKPTNPFQETNGRNQMKFAEGLGARIGGKWNLSSQLAAGLSLSSPVYFTKFGGYTDVLPYRIELPMQIGGGLTWRVLPTTDILADVNGYLWKLSKITNTSPAQGGFGWRNTLAVMTGINHRINDKWIVRVGYQYSMTPVQNKFLFENAFAAAHAYIKHFVTTGLKVNVTPCVALNAAVAYGFPTKLTDSGNGPLGAFTRNVTMKASSIYGMVGFTWSY